MTLKSEDLLRTETDKIRHLDTLDWSYKTHIQDMPHTDTIHIQQNIFLRFLAT